jgi:magnesium-transporting ATPase (P-type)
MLKVTPAYHSRTVIARSNTAYLPLDVLQSSLAVGEPKTKPARSCKAAAPNQPLALPTVTMSELSPLQKELKRVTKIVTVLATSVGLLFFVLAIALAGVSLAESFIFAVGMIVAFVPEGILPIENLISRC